MFATKVRTMIFFGRGVVVTGKGIKRIVGAGNSLFLEIIEHIKEGIENIKKPPRKYKR